MEYAALLKDTILLQRYNQELQDIYEKVSELGESADFFTIVKPYADKVKDVLDRWKESVLTWIQVEKPKYFHRQQVDNIIENISTVTVQAFFPDTKAKRFKHLIKSNQYTLDSIRKHIEK
jgi:gas vesicle protein